MDRVFAGPAGDRRRFLDRQVLAHFPSHAAAGAAYEKAMRQRNALLEQGRADPAWLDALELGMASAGAAMAIHRVDAVKVMQEAILARPEGAFPKALIDLDGDFETARRATAWRSPISSRKSSLSCAKTAPATRPQDARRRAFTAPICASFTPPKACPPTSARRASRRPC